MGAEVCLLLAVERSGTHLLRSLLGNVRGVVAPGEICNATIPHNRSAKTSYFLYREEACRAEPEYFFPTEPVQRKLLDGFVDSLRANHSGKRLIVLDVKYAHVHNFNFFWWDPLEKPYLIQYAKRKRLKVLHLIRRNVYRTAISGFYANESGVWRAKSEQDTRRIRITVDPERLDRKARAIARCIAKFEDWLSACPHLQIDYEDLTENRDATLESLRTYLGLKQAIANEPGFVKTTPPLEETVENFAEIEPLLDRNWKDLARRGAGNKRPRPARPAKDSSG